MKLLELLRLPETRDIEDIDHPATTLLHRRIIRSKPFLRKLYTDFYKELRKAIPDYENKLIVELGSGALEMPFESSSIDAIVMLDVFHHLPDPKAFFTEAVRCLKPTGKVVMIEPANTLWSRFIYMHFHHELFDPGAGWTLDTTGPLSGGNGAMPWIVFCRDRKRYEQEFPGLRIVGIRRHTPLRYLLSGGFTLRQLVPSAGYQFFRLLEMVLSPANAFLAMFQTIELEKVTPGTERD